MEQQQEIMHKRLYNLEVRNKELEMLVDLLNLKLEYQALGCYDQRNDDYEDIFNDSEL